MLVFGRPVVNVFQGLGGRTVSPWDLIVWAGAVALTVVVVGFGVAVVVAMIVSAIRGKR